MHTGRLKLLILLLKREFKPASDGDGKLNFFIHKLPIYFLPIVCFFCLVLFMSCVGQKIIINKSELDWRIKCLQRSPYTGLFVNGTFISGDRTEGKAKEFTSPDLWRSLLGHDVFSDGEVPDAVLSYQIFNSISLVTIKEIDIEKRNGSHLQAQRCLALQAPTNEINSNLQDEILKNIIHGNPVKNWSRTIFISSFGMKMLGYNNPSEYPTFIYLRINNLRFEEPVGYVPFQLVVAKNLPFFNYLVSTEEARNLEYGFYQDKINEFDFGFNDKLPTLPFHDAIISNVFKRYDRNCVTIQLQHLLERFIILDKLAKKGLLRMSQCVWLESSNDKPYPNDYNAAIFYLNYDLPDKYVWDAKAVSRIQTFIQSKNKIVESELVELISVMLNTQSHLNDFQIKFRYLLSFMILVLALFFVVFLLARTYRIGVLRVVGVANFDIYILYFVFCFIVVMLAFALSLCCNIL